MAGRFGTERTAFSDFSYLSHGGVTSAVVFFANGETPIISANRRRYPARLANRPRIRWLLADLGEGFRMPSGVREPPMHEPAGLRSRSMGFRVLLGYCGFGTGPSLELEAAGRVNSSARRGVDREPAAAQIQSCRANLGERRDPGHSPRRGCCGVGCAQAVPGHDGLLPVAAGA